MSHVCVSIGLHRVLPGETLTVSTEEQTIFICPFLLDDDVSMNELFPTTSTLTSLRTSNSHLIATTDENGKMEFTENASDEDKKGQLEIRKASRQQVTNIADQVATDSAQKDALNKASNNNNKAKNEEDQQKIYNDAKSDFTKDNIQLGTREEGFGAEVKRRILIGTYALSAGYYDAYYLKAQKCRQLVANDFTEAFKNVDVILSPTTPGTSFKAGEKTNDPIEMYLQDIFTVHANLTGNPAISIPKGKNSEGMPFGIQLMANHFEESEMLAFAKHIEEL